MSINSQIVEVLSLVGGVHNCHQMEENHEIVDHYDCREDIKKAIQVLTEVNEELEYREAIK